MQPKVIACDFDDTLAPEIEFVESGFNAVAGFFAAEYGVDAQLACSAFWRAFKASHKNVFDRAAAGLGLEIPQSAIARAVDVYRSHKPSLSYYCDVRPFLARIAQRGLKTAIITDGFAPTQRNKITAVGAEKDFCKIIYTGELGADFAKPSPKSFEMLARYFGVELGEIVYIGDNVHKDFAFAAEIPVKTFRIIRPDIIHNYGDDYLGGVRPTCGVVSSLEQVKF